MSAQKGNLFLIGVGSGSGSTITYTNVTSARSVDWTINNSQVDVTTITSAGWKTLLEGAGIQSMSITLSGAWEDAAIEQAVVSAATGNTFLNLKFTNGNDDEFTGSFSVTTYKRAGTYNGEETYNATFDSNGAVAYTPGS